MGPFFGPLHLLFLAESFADHFVDRRLHKARRDRLAVVIALPIIRNHMPVMRDIRAQLRQRLDQSREPGIRLFEGRDRGLEIVDLGPAGAFERICAAAHIGAYVLYTRSSSFFMLTSQA